MSGMPDGTFVMVPEMRPAIARVKRPVVDEDGYVTHHEVAEFACAVHTAQIGKGGWVCETTEGDIMVVPYENVRFADVEDDE